MGSVRLWRRKKIAPGVTLNLSKHGISTSFGVRGAHYTVGHGRRRMTVGIPGTGVYYTSYNRTHARRAGGRSRRTSPTSAAPQNGNAIIKQRFADVPSRKIAWGLLYTVLVITAPIGIPLLVVGLIQLPQRKWKARTLVQKANGAAEPLQAKALLDRAQAVAPDEPEVAAALAGWHFNQHQWAAAVPLYEQYLQLAPGDWLARGHLGNALLNAGQYDQAIATLQQVRATAPLTEESHASLTAGVALAFLYKGDATQALELLKTEPLRRQQLGEGLQHCLFLRGACEYLAGRKQQGITDLDRLYAVNPGFDGLAEAKAEMTAGTFSIAPAV